MIRTILAAALALGAGPALATEWIYCSDATNTVSADLLMGAMDVVAIAGVVLSKGEQVWASHTAYGPGEPIEVGQAFEDAVRLDVDLMDGGFVKIAELRLLKASEGDMFVYSGTLRMPGQGAWAVSCGGP